MWSNLMKVKLVDQGCIAYFHKYDWCLKRCFIGSIMLNVSDTVHVCASENNRYKINKRDNYHYTYGGNKGHILNVYKLLETGVEILICIATSTCCTCRLINSQTCRFLYLDVQ